MKKKISLLTLTICVLLLCTACARSTEQQIAQQLELGQRYLEEGDYEAAIVAFTKVIELDEKNAEAYLCIADAYIQQEDYEAALNILQEGLEKTDDAGISQKIEEINNKLENTEDDGVDSASSAETGYPVLVLSEDIKAAFQTIIDDCLSNNYMHAVDILWSDDFYELAKECASQKEYSWEVYQGMREDDDRIDIYIKTMYEDYHVYISYIKGKEKGDGGVDFVFLPENGSGGMVSSYRYMKGGEAFRAGDEDTESTKEDGYMICKTEDYRFNGDFSASSVTDIIKIELDSSYTFEDHASGQLKNNLLDGTKTLECRYDSGFNYMSIEEYEDGILQPQVTEEGVFSNIRRDDDGEWYGYILYEEDEDRIKSWGSQTIWRACDLDGNISLREVPWQ